VVNETLEIKVKFYYWRDVSNNRKYLLQDAVAQLVDALRYKPEGRGFDSRWCQWNLSLT
jgi:hypothetical protein